MKEFHAGIMGPQIEHKEPFREGVRADWPHYGKSGPRSLLRPLPPGAPPKPLLLGWEFRLGAAMR